ncbi:hypothetical protein E1301_Tti024043 [Triplophysa tibetana]|uniref:Fibroblast growth factor n=1 Tax=Triplophysa tibetana TaxID=1572043 RepID=A0A5A9NLU4_9TELE|nr:hypothetical protein E1301_Tti024043 [Triplophysa tibetana]
MKLFHDEDVNSCEKGRGVPVKTESPPDLNKTSRMFRHRRCESVCLCVVVRLQLQATAVGEVLIKGTCANRYLAMSADGRLFGTYRSHEDDDVIPAVTRMSSGTEDGCVDDLILHMMTL